MVQDLMSNLGFVDVDYCKRGLNYRKRARVWTNLNGLWQPRSLRKKDCGAMDGNKQKETAQRGPSGKKGNYPQNYIRHKQEDLYKIPSTLIYETFSAIE